MALGVCTGAFGEDEGGTGGGRKGSASWAEGSLRPRPEGDTHAQTQNHDVPDPPAVSFA